MHTEVGTLETSLGRDRLIVEDTHHQDGAVTEEHELSAGAKDSGRFGDPQIRVGPDGGAVFGDGDVEALVPEGKALGDAVDQGKAQVELALESPCVGQLAGRIVDADHSPSPPGHPGRDISAATTQLDDVSAANVGKDVHLGVGNSEDAPLGYVLLPSLAVRRSVIGGVLVPSRAIDGYVVGGGDAGHEGRVPGGLCDPSPYVGGHRVELEPAMA